MPISFLTKRRNCMLKKWLIFCVAIALSFSQISSAADPVAHWSFDEVEVENRKVEMFRGETFIPKEKFSFIKEEVSGSSVELQGKYYKIVDGVKNKAVLLDGYTAFVQVEVDEVPRTTGDFSVEAWVALGAYPKHWCPIVDHQRAVEDGYFNGFFFGLDANGRLLLKVATEGKYEQVVSKEHLPLREWKHLAGVHEDGVLKVYINGELAGTTKLTQPFKPMDEEEYFSDTLLIGKSRMKHRPYGTIRPEGTMEVNTHLDGIIDEVKLYHDALSSSDISKAYKAAKPSAKPQLPVRKLPIGPPSSGKFGVIPTTLKYYPSWDAPWHVGDNADLVVLFDQTPCRFILWRGTSYIPHWVTENGIWYNNGFNEGWNERGSCEPMSDKRTLYSRVQIVENNDARVVVMWRYGLIDNWGTFAFQDPTTGWGDWVEETFTIYPDMVGVRSDTIYSNAPRAEHEWQESMMVLSPGQRPEDILEYGALSVANIDGDEHTYSWEHAPPPLWPKDPKNISLQLVNTKSKYRPFSIVRPQDITEDKIPHGKPQSMDIYAGEIRREFSVFPWWNHWPVAPRPTDGRWCMHDDRAAHASLAHWFWGEYQMTDNSATKIHLHGMTDKSVTELIPLSKSWSYPATLSVKKGDVLSHGYDPRDMAFHLTAKKPGESMTFEINGSAKSPVVNPGMVIKGYGDREFEIKIDGKEAEYGEHYRSGHRLAFGEDDLILWLKIESEKKVTVTITAEAEDDDD